jgi:hypothetical protein
MRMACKIGRESRKRPVCSPRLKPFLRSESTSFRLRGRNPRRILHGPQRPSARCYGTAGAKDRRFVTARRDAIPSHAGRLCKPSRCPNSRRRFVSAVKTSLRSGGADYERIMVSIILKGFNALRA